MENMVINDLLEKYKRNSKLSVADRETFENEFGLMIKEKVYNEDIENILCEGPLDITMKIFAKYLVENKEDISNAIIKKFLYCKRIEDNKGGVSGMRMVYLLSSLLEMQSKNEIVKRRVFNSLVHMAYKNGKEGTNKKVVDLIRTNILPKISESGDILDLKFMVRDQDWINVRNLFIECAYEDFNVSLDIKQRVFYWLKGTERDMGTFTEEFLSNKCFQIEENAFEKQINDTQQDESNSKGKNSLEGIDVEECVKHLVIYSSMQEQVINRMNIELAALKQKIDEIQNQVLKCLAFEQTQESKINELQNNNYQLYATNKELEKNVDYLNSLVDRLNKEIDDRKQFTDTVVRNREKQSEEFINRLAAKLKVEYRDFCDAEGLEMTVDLGENMRAQLDSVFNTLEKNGVRLK